MSRRGAYGHAFSRRRPKYNAKKTVIDGIIFDSKREGAYYEELKVRQERGDIVFFLMQVPLRLPGGTKLVIDFVEWHDDGTCHFVDVKGFITDVFKLKRREVEHHYPFTIEIVK